MSAFASHYPYWISVILMMSGLYTVIASENLVKKLIGLSLFQASVLLMYVAAGKVMAGTAPILVEGVTLYSNPLPHVLMLTAIVVGISVLAVGLALAVRIQGAYGTLEEHDIIARDNADKGSGA